MKLVLRVYKAGGFTSGKAEVFAALADAGEGTLLEELSQLPVGGLGDEQARRVRADVDAGVGHPKRRPGLGRGD